MTSKLIKPDFNKDSTNSRDTLSGILNGILIRDSIRKREIEQLIIRNLELEEIVFRMNSKIDRIAQSSSG